MNPQTTQAIAQLQKQIDNLRSAHDVPQTENIRRRVLQDVIVAGVVDAATSNENETTVIAAGGGSVAHAESYDQRVRVTIDGSNYYIGLYTA